MDDLIYSSFGEVLRALRKRQGIHQQEIAAKLGVHRNTIGKWERGDCLPESRTMVLELARCLHLPGPETRLLLEASLTTISPRWSVPYPRNPFFTGRGKILEKLHGLLHQDTRILMRACALSGLGGIGKTQTALEYAYRYANTYTAIFWVSAETCEQIASSMATIADVLHLPERGEQDQNRIVAAVIRWLETHTHWLLIFDNVEDIELVKGVLPAARSGSLLFTSRRQALGMSAQTLDLEKMAPEEGLSFLLRRAGLLALPASLTQLVSADVRTAQEILVVLDGLPLALDQAGAYIEATHCSLSDYLKLFSSYQLRLLDERGNFMDHPLSVVKTLTLAFERLERDNPAAMELLTACAFLAPEAIPESFFEEGAPHLGPAFEALATDSLQFQAALKTLLDFSLIQRDATAHLLTVHRLLQTVLRGRLSAMDQNRWMRRVIGAMTHLFPPGKLHTDYWRICERLVSHALACVALSEQGSGYVLERATLMCHVATYLTNRAQMVRAHALYQRALEMSEQVLGSGHLRVAKMLQGLANLCFDQGKYGEAETYYRRVLRLRERALGPQHLQVSSTLNNLAALYQAQGRYGEAKSLYQRALQISEQALGAEHPKLAYVLNNLALLSVELGRYAEAEPLYLRALQIREQAFGPDDPEAAFPLTNLANLYVELDRYAEAEPLYQRALNLREQTLGADHPQVAYPLQGLADLYRKQGRTEEAELLFLRALQIWEQASNTQHPDAVYALQGLANLYRARGVYEQAHPLYQRALALLHQHRDPHHPQIAECLSDLARFHQVQQQDTEALSLYRQALTIRIHMLGRGHPKTIRTRTDYTCLLQEMRQTGETERLTTIPLGKNSTSGVSKNAALPVEQSRAEQPACPSCQRRDAVVGSGVNRAGTRRFRCRSCQRYFTPERKKRGYDISLKDQALALVHSGSSARFVAQKLHVHHSTISLWVLQNRKREQT